MPDSPLKEIASVLPEFHFDVLARVVPGVLTVALYGWEKTQLTSSFASVSLVLVLGYVIGITIDVLSDMILGKPLLFIGKLLSPIFKRLTYENVRPIRNDQRLWGDLRRAGDSQYLVLTKMMAEKAMLRGAILIAIVTVFFPPDLLTPDRRCLSFVALFVLVFSHVTLNGYINGRIPEPAEIPDDVISPKAS